MWPIRGGCSYITVARINCTVLPGISGSFFNKSLLTVLISVPLELVVTICISDPCQSACMVT